MSLSLNCLIYGEDQEKMFTVEIEKTKSVSILKKLIKEEKASLLNHVDASDLDLWMVNISLGELGEPMHVDLDNYSKLSPPRKKLSFFIGDRVVGDEYLHIIAKAPVTQPVPVLDPTQLLSLNCFVLGDDLKKVFTVEIEKTKNVSILKDLIKEKKAPHLDHVAASDLDLWNVSIPVDDDADERLKSINNLEPLEAFMRLSVFPRVEESHLHILVRAPTMATNDHLHSDEQRDSAGDLPEIRRYETILKTKGLTPSQGAKSTEYPAVQANLNTAIHDGRYPPNRTFPTIAPPLEIFHPVFAGFLYLIRDENIQPTNQDLEHVRELLSYAAMVSNPEVPRNAEIRRRLTKILQLQVHEEPNTDRTSADGVYMIMVGDVRIPLLIVELKRELGDGGCDPTTQVGITMRRSWIQEDRAEIRDRCCCPTLMLAGGGPWLGVMGGVFTDKIIVQRLTSLMWIAESSTEEDARIYDAARVFVALRKSLEQLTTFYKKIGEFKIPRVINGKTHPRFYPYPTSFTVEKQTFHFRYLKPMEDHVACETYLAKLDDPPGNIVVKFVSRYSKEVHEFLANKNYAPHLRYYGPMPDAPPSPPRPKNAPAGLAFGFMQMVVMDYIVPSRDLPTDAVQQIRGVLITLHASGYVFGDLREPNILFDADHKIKLIDFNWCGRYDADMEIPDSAIPADVQKMIDENKIRFPRLPLNEYAHYPNNLSTSIEWPADVGSLKPIRPQHDWFMWNNLKMCSTYSSVR